MEHVRAASAVTTRAGAVRRQSAGQKLSLRPLVSMKRGFSAGREMLCDEER